MGRKLKFPTPQKMRDAIESYIDAQLLQDKPLTIAGLVRVLGFKNRQSLLDYSVKDEYCEIIQKAKNRIEEYLEESLFTNERFRGARFCLSVNFGWVEQREPVTNDSQIVIVNDIPRAGNGA